MLKVHKVCKSYVIPSYNGEKKAVHANQDISLCVPNGQCIWIMGNSGTGKSTFLNVSTGIDTADSGSVLWDDTDITKLSARERALFRLKHCGLVFQFFELIKTQNVYENIALPMHIARKSHAHIQQRVHALLTMFSLESLAYKKPALLSGGERQRVAIARALANEPKYIIADEITAALDPKLSKTVYTILQDYIKTHNGTGLFVSHDPIIRDFVDASYVMQEGRLSVCTL